MACFESTPEPVGAWITVVIPTRGRTDLVRQAVLSVLADGGAHAVVVDDSGGSMPTVGTFDDPDVRVTVVCSGGQGPAGARNIGAERAATRWLTFLDDDDQLESGGLGHVRRSLDAAARDVGLVFCAVSIRRDQNGRGELLPPADLGPLFRSVKGQLLAGGFCVRRDVFESMGGYESTLRYSENTELVLRAIEYCSAHGLAILTVESCLASIWRRPAGDRSSNTAGAINHGAEFMLSQHADAFERDPMAAAAYHRVAGVNAARLRDRNGADTHFTMAVTLGSHRKDRLRGRLLRVPLLWRIVWRP